MKKDYFEGWYYKHQVKNPAKPTGETLIIIPGRANDTAFIQVITDEASHYITFPLSKYKLFYRRKFGSYVLRIGNNYFSPSGIKLKINRPDFSLRGYFEYHNLTHIKGHIMGPFRYLKMECRHGIISMKHDIRGEVILNGELYNFDKGVGYIEYDNGRSFPRGYTWVQSNDFYREASIMAAVAEIPFNGLYFLGCICVVWLNGREYRLATYKGAKIIRCEQNLIELRQGKYHLVIALRQDKALKLAAPKDGLMKRLVKESPSCPAVFIFKENGKVLFSGESRGASYEWMM